MLAASLLCFGVAGIFLRLGMCAHVTDRMTSRPMYCLPSTRSTHDTPDCFDSERRHT